MKTVYTTIVVTATATPPFVIISKLIVKWAAKHSCHGKAHP
jgi:hypothetical protein